MSKHILVLTGSPRKKGNSDAMAEAFIKGAKAKGHTVDKFEAALKPVEGCRACEACWSKGEACVFKDGFTELALLLPKADVIALVSPVYFYDLTAQIKAAIDKLYAFMVPACKQPLKIKESALLMCAEDPSDDAFAGAIATYKSITALLNWADRGIVTAGGLHHAGEIAGNAVLQKSEELGASL